MKTSKIARYTGLSIRIGQSRKTVSAVLLVTAGIILASVASAQLSDDHLFAKRGTSTLTIGTGVPLVGFAEYAYGVGGGFTVGMFAGTTPAGPGYGLRLRGVIYQKKETFRIYMKSPLIYYSKNDRKGIEPWVLAWPSISAEWKLDSGMRLSIGGGIIATSCVDALLGTGDHPDEPEPVQEVMMMNGVWNTLNAGVTIPVNDRLVFHTEAALVFDGLKPAGTHWVGGTPVVLVIGMSYHF